LPSDSISNAFGKGIHIWPANAGNMADSLLLNLNLHQMQPKIHRSNHK